jgi:hypothetical protein
MFKSDNKEYKNNLNSFKLNRFGCNDTLNTLDTLDTIESNETIDIFSHSIRSRTNSNSSNIGNSRTSSIEIDFNSDKKYNNFLCIKKKECLEICNNEIKPKKKRIKNEDLFPISKSPNIPSILEKIPSLKLNKILNNSYKDISSNVLEIK